MREADAMSEASWWLRRAGRRGLDGDIARREIASFDTASNSTTDRAARLNQETEGTVRSDASALV